MNHSTLRYNCVSNAKVGLAQRAKKVMSDSPGLVIKNSVFNLPDGQVMFSEEFE